MKRKRIIWGVLAVCGFGAVAAGVVGLRWAATQPPDFYAAAVAASPPPAARREAAERFAERTAELIDEIRYAPVWEQEFTQGQVNAWLAEELPRRFGSRIPKGVSDPRVEFDNGLVRIGFQLTTKQFNGIVSVALRPSVAGPNQLAVTIEGLSAGLLPLAPAPFTDDVSRQLDRYDVEHEWQTADGHPVLLLAIVPTRRDRPVLETIEVDDERLRVAGRRDTPTALTLNGSRTLGIGVALRDEESRSL